MTNEEVAVKLESHEQEIRTLKDRMKGIEESDKTLSELTTSVKTLAVNMEYMAKEQQKQGERLERLEREPSDNYKHYKRILIGCIITTVVGAFLGALLTLIIK